MSTRRRLALAAAAVTSVGAVATLAAGFTFGLFSATDPSPPHNTFTAGTVSVAPGSPASVACTITNMTPGDSSTGAPSGSKADTPCTYNVQYTGSVGAYVAVDVTISNGSTALYDASATGLHLYLNNILYGTSYYNPSGPATLLAGTTPNLLVNTGGGPPPPVNAGTTFNFSLDYALPLTAGNGYQGGSTTVTLTFHAVQAAGNALPANCSPDTQCPSGGSFAWS